MDQIKPSNQTIIYMNNVPMLYEYQDDPTNFGTDRDKFENSSDSDELNQMINNYRDIHGRLESTTTSKDTSLKDFHNGVSYSASSSSDPEVGKKLFSSEIKKSVNISSLFDSTHEISQKEYLEQLQSFAENNSNTEILIGFLKKLEEYESQIIHLNEVITEEKTELYNNNTKLQNLQNQINSLTNNTKKLDFELSNLNEEFYHMDRRIIENNQYARRESIIISGIPENIDQQHLEEKVLFILSSIGLNRVSSYNISACHRLAKKKNDKFPAQTIVRFTNRKIVNFCLINRNRLLESKKQLKMNLRFYESLCESNKQVYYECYDLKKYGFIKDFYIRNGFVKIIRDGYFPTKIHHPDDLHYYFEDYFECKQLYTTR